MDGEGTRRAPAKPYARWSEDTERAFLLALRMTGQVTKAVEEIGRTSSGAYGRRQRFPAFAREWDAVVAAQQAEWIAARQEALGPGRDDAGGGRLTRWRARADGWDARKRRVFLQTLARTKNVREASRAAGISSNSAYYLRSQSPPFARAWAKALAADLPSVVEAAYERAVNGWKEPIVHGGKVTGHRRRYSDALLRLLLLHEQAEAARAAARAEGDAAAEAAGASPGDPQAVRRAREVAHAAGGYFAVPATREETNARLEELMRRLDIVRARAEAGGGDDGACDIGDGEGPDGAW